MPVIAVTTTVAKEGVPLEELLKRLAENRQKAHARLEQGPPSGNLTHDKIDAAFQEYELSLRRAGGKDHLEMTANEQSKVNWYQMLGFLSSAGAGFGGVGGVDPSFLKPKLAWRGSFGYRWGDCSLRRYSWSKSHAQERTCCRTIPLRD